MYSVLESDRRAIKEHDLFPSGDSAQQLINIVTSTEQTMELPYATFSFLSADEAGPPGMVFVAPQGVQYPIDSVWIKPSIEKQLERKQVEQQRAKDEREMVKMEESIREIKFQVEHRDALERKTKLETKLKRLLNCARQSHALLHKGEDNTRPPAGMQDEYAVWKQLEPKGLPPPPQKHAISILYEFQVEKSINLNSKPKAGSAADNAEVDVDEDDDSTLVGLVLTFEVWSTTFTERYNIFLSAKNSVTRLDMKLETLGFPELTWVRTHVFNAQMAPSLRDAPGLCHDGKDGLYFFGGKTKGGDYKTYFNDFWRFNYSTNQWYMFQDSVKTYENTRWIETVGLKGTKPTSRSSCSMVYRREGESRSNPFIAHMLNSISS